MFYSRKFIMNLKCAPSIVIKEYIMSFYNYKGECMALFWDSSNHLLTVVSLSKRQLAVLVIINTQKNKH